MPEHPTLETERLILRLFTLDDAPEIYRLLQERDVADTLLNVPHPYEKGMAEQWIGAQQEAFGKRQSVNFAIVHKEEGFLIGSVSLGNINRAHGNAELGYWVGKPYWNQGYCTEAARAVLGYGFATLGLNRIYARHMTRNPASGRVMQKLGMKHEGTLRQDRKKWGKFEDFEICGILRSEYMAADGRIL
ncbi:MAG: GNAT family N-acetyltransferase [Chloroflexi bacterium]|nr:GNAT family N-acetyltransferase [Chloroflexota bacterium]